LLANFLKINTTDMATSAKFSKVTIRKHILIAVVSLIITGLIVTAVLV
jgi:hypothetical protein